MYCLFRIRKLSFFFNEEHIVSRLIWKNRRSGETKIAVHSMLNPQGDVVSNLANGSDCYERD